MARDPRQRNSLIVIINFGHEFSFVWRKWRKYATGLLKIVPFFPSALKLPQAISLLKTLNAYE